MWGRRQDTANGARHPRSAECLQEVALAQQNLVLTEAAATVPLTEAVATVLRRRWEQLSAPHQVILINRHLHGEPARRRFGQTSRYMSITSEPGRLENGVSAPRMNSLCALDSSTCMMGITQLFAVK